MLSDAAVSLISHATEHPALDRRQPVDDAECGAHERARELVLPDRLLHRTQRVPHRRKAIAPHLSLIGLDRVDQRPFPGFAGDDRITQPYRILERDISADAA